MPYIKKTVIDRVYEEAVIEEVIGDFVTLKKRGANYTGLSPFTKEKTPSFTVSPAKNIWKDFSSGKGGNVISFLIESQNMEWIDAIKYIAKKYNIHIEYDDSKEAKRFEEKRKKQESLRPLLVSTIKKYHEEFKKLPNDHPAKIEVYQHRGYTDEIVNQYQIGYAPGKKFIWQKVQEIGRFQDAEKIGLVNANNDKFINRVIYPLFASKGGVSFPVGLAGRRLDANTKYPKWYNSPQSELYDKSKFWYGLDSARKSIVKAGEVWIVEGYNDVIAFQTNGIPNTVAGCGTAISEMQIKALKKLTDKVVFCQDPDKAGRRAMLKYIPAFIEHGFRVQTAFLSEAFDYKQLLDPDDFIRQINADYHTAYCQVDFTDLTDIPDIRKDGFKFLMDENFRDKDAVEVAQAAYKLTELINNISDSGLRDIYSEWLAQESGQKKSLINKWLKETHQKIIDKLEKGLQKNNEPDIYHLPKEVKKPLKDLEPTIEKYHMFMANNKIYMQTGEEAPYYFQPVSNFSIEILQHLEDEEYPMKLVKVSNIHKDEKIFDVISSKMNTPLAFEEAVTDHGNYQWRGNRQQHQLLKAYLFDNMGVGRKIDVLGMQPEGFFAFNNLIVDFDGKDQEISEHGTFEKNGVSYYIPSANKIYKNSRYKYESQKKALHFSTKITFQNFCDLVTKVHRNHGMMGILFSIASMFQDIVVENTGSFPMLFLYGPPSSGKDQLASVCQSFFGIPQTAINLEGDTSTAKAKIREFAQFSNFIAHLSEYKSGDGKLDGTLKGLWDRNGYKRGTLASKVSNESIPILSSVIMTGNDQPNNDALISRLIWCFMNKDTFTDEEKQNFQKLTDIVSQGISSFTVQFLRYRSTVVKEFKKINREFQKTLAQRKPDVTDRLIQNLSVLGTFYQIFREDFHFSFSQAEMMAHFEKTIEKESIKLNSASIIHKWWDCFLASMRGSLQDQIMVGRDFSCNGNQFFFNFTNCFNRIQRQWFVQYRENAPGKSVMMEALKKDDSFIETKGGHRFGSGRSGKSSSAYVVKANSIPNFDELMVAIDWQEGTSAAINQSQQNEAGNDPESNQEDLPF